MPMELYTPRLVLREVMPDDVDAILSFGLDPANRRYEPFTPPDAEGFTQMVNWMIAQQAPQPRTFYYLALALRAQPAIAIGSMHLTILSHIQRQGEIGYLMGSPYQRQGYATEAASRLVAFGFGDLALESIIADDIVSENIASIRVAQHLGMTLVAHRTDAQFFAGRWWDTLTYGLNRQDWQRQQGQESE